MPTTMKSPFISLANSTCRMAGYRTSDDLRCSATDPSDTQAPLTDILYLKGHVLVPTTAWQPHWIHPWAQVVSPLGNPEWTIVDPQAPTARGMRCEPESSGRSSKTPSQNTTATHTKIRRKFIIARASDSDDSSDTRHDLLNGFRVKRRLTIQLHRRQVMPNHSLDNRIVPKFISMQSRSQRRNAGRQTCICFIEVNDQYFSLVKPTKSTNCLSRQPESFSRVFDYTSTDQGTVQFELPSSIRREPAIAFTSTFETDRFRQAIRPIMRRTEARPFLSWYDNFTGNNEALKVSIIKKSVELHVPSLAISVTLEQHLKCIKGRF